jgi:acyl carrier protein
VDRRALAGAEIKSEREYVAARTATEQRVAEIWSQVLGVARVGVEENFFELGGHSLLATQAVSRLRAAFGVEIALRWMFESPTVARLAVVIEERLGEQTEKDLPAVEAVARGEQSFEQLLAKLQSLSSDDVKEILSQKKSTLSDGVSHEQY